MPLRGRGEEEARGGEGGMGGNAYPKVKGVAWGEIKPKNCSIRAVFGRGVRAIVRGIF